ncbi:MAG: Calx-beta domain-containing protein [Planctomycetota bacterium]
MKTTPFPHKTAALALLALAAGCDDIGSDGESLTPAGPPVGAEFEVTSSSVSESTPSVVVAVTLPEPEALGVGVIFDSIGTAEEGVDFDPVPPSVLIPAGETRAEFTITLRDDALFEDDEELVLEIVNLATAGNVDIGEDRTLTVEIVDDDTAPTASFAVGPTSAFENGGPIIVPIVLDAPSGLEVRVPVTLAGTADGDDVEPLAEEVVLAPGETRVDLVVEPISDGETEGAETLELGFGALVGATAGAADAVTVTLEDAPATPTLRDVVFTRTTADFQLGLYSADVSGVVERLNESALIGEHALSPDRSAAAFVAETEDGAADGVFVVATGAAPLEVSGAEGPIGTMLAWSPSGDAVAYAAVRPSGLSAALYVAEADGSGAAELDADVSLGLGAGELAWAPDGSRVAFTAFVDAEQRVFAANRDGSDVVDLTDAVGATATRGGFQWSSDGARLAFRDATGLYVANADGTSPGTLSGDLLIGPFEDEPDFVWTSDGSAVLFRGAPGGAPAQLFRAPADGSAAPTAITALGEDVEAGWRLAPDGSRVAYFGRDAGGDGIRLFEVAPDGSSTLQIGASISGTERVVDCLWSPDGARVAHRVRNAVQVDELWCATSGIVTSAVRISGAVTPADYTNDDYTFSPDGTRIAYADVRLLTAVSGENELFSNAVTGGDERSHSGPWPTALRVLDFAWSPDGTRIWSRQTLSQGQSSLWSAPVDQSTAEAEAPGGDALSTQAILRFDAR